MLPPCFATGVFGYLVLAFWACLRFTRPNDCRQKHPQTSKVWFAKAAVVRELRAPLDYEKKPPVIALLKCRQPSKTTNRVTNLPVLKSVSWVMTQHWPYLLLGPKPTNSIGWTNSAVVTLVRLMLISGVQNTMSAQKSHTYKTPRSSWNISIFSVFEARLEFFWSWLMLLTTKQCFASLRCACVCVFQKEEIWCKK